MTAKGVDGHRHAGDLERALGRLRESRLRETAPRRGILSVLAGEHGPFTIEEIHGRMGTSCDLVTVYRSVSAMEGIGLIDRCDFGDGAYRYELAADASHHHHHLVCRKCHRSLTLETECQVESLERAARAKGFSEVSHSLEIFGVCPDCKEKSRRG